MKEIIIAIIGSGALSALVSALVSLMNAKQRAKKGNDDLILMMSAYSIYSLGEAAIKDGYISFRKLELFNDMYNKYKEQKNANGYADVIKEKVNSLPIKD